MTLEFNKPDFDSIQNFVNQMKNTSKVTYLENYSFLVKMFNPGVDLEIKVKLKESQSKEQKDIFITTVLDAISAYSTESEQHPEKEMELIRNVLNVKSANRISNNLSFVIDFGSANPDLAFPVIFKAIESTAIPIELVEVK